MAPEKAPAFQFYPKDFLTDSHVVAMNMAERGVYITLLCLCWLDHSIPSDHAALARICRVSLSSFDRLWPALEPCFMVSGGRLKQPRIERERKKQQTYRALKVAAGAAGGKAKAEAKQTASKDLAEASPPSSSSSSFFGLRKEQEQADLKKLHPVLNETIEEETRRLERNRRAPRFR